MDARSESGAGGGLFASVFDNAPIGMAIGDLDGRFTRVNRSFCELLRYSEDELLVRGFADITHPDDVQQSIDWGQRLLAGEARSFQLEKRYVDRDGRPIWVNLSVSMIYDHAGAPTHFVSQFEDISERKEAELAVIRERDHSAAIIAAMGEGYMLTVDGRISVVNDALVELTGFAREELIGACPPWPFWPPEAVHKNNALRDVVLADGGTTFEVQLMQKDRTRFVGEVTTRPAHNADGSVLGWVSTVRDISERRRYEAELERLATHDALTGLPNHRTFHQRLDEEFAYTVRHGRPLCVALVDIDRFKSINDGHGHIVGDRVLAAVAQRMADVVRQGEMLARVGGEEFGWILPGSDGGGALAAAERARSAVNTEPFVPVGRLTISIGVAELDEPRDRSRLYQCADESLYEAKRLGRDRVVLFGGPPERAAHLDG